jgi:hypothetical protein
MLLRLAALCLAALLPACATVTSGTTQAISVMSDPPGAACLLRREGALVGVMHPTPGTVTIGKSTRDLAVSCTRAGSLATARSVPAEFQAMTAGNILLGGVIGLAVDAASGAMSKYPETIHLVLAPDSFPSAAERDAYFGQRIAEARQMYEGRIATSRSTCPANNQTYCDAQVAKLEEERDAEIARLERQRGTARAT